MTLKTVSGQDNLAKCFNQKDKDIYFLDKTFIFWTRPKKNGQWQFRLWTTTILGWTRTIIHVFRQDNRWEDKAVKTSWCCLPLRQADVVCCLHLFLLHEFNSDITIFEVWTTTKHKKGRPVVFSQNKSRPIGLKNSNVLFDRAESQQHRCGRVDVVLATTQIHIDRCGPGG